MTFYFLRKSLGKHKYADLALDEPIKTIKEQPTTNHTSLLTTNLIEIKYQVMTRAIYTNPGQQHFHNVGMATSLFANNIFNSSDSFNINLWVIIINPLWQITHAFSSLHYIFYFALVILFYAARPYFLSDLQLYFFVCLSNHYHHEFFDRYSK